MFRRLLLEGCVLGFGAAFSAFSGPVIDPLANASIPAGKSLTIPITATSTNGRPLTYTVTSSTNRITVELHTNNPFWKLSVVQVAPANDPGAFLTPFRGTLAMVTNVGDLTLMLFRDRAPKTVEVFQGLTMSGFFSSNTIFHRVIPGFMIQGGDPATNGGGGPIFRFDDEFHPRAIFSGRGQLAMANSGKDTDGSQFFITQVPYRSLDFNHTIFGQLLRGFNTLSNVINTPRNAGDRPLKDVIIARASLVTNYTDTVITLTGTNLAGVAGTIRVIADDGTAGGRVTNTFTATTVSDAANNAPPFLYPSTVTNLVAPVNTSLTNVVSWFDLEGTAPGWFLNWTDLPSYQASSNTTWNPANGRLIIIPASGFVGKVGFYTDVSDDGFISYDTQTNYFVFGDTAIAAWPSNFTATALAGVTNQLLATFTNGVPNSSATNFSAFINWGDNVITSGTFTTNAGGRKEVRGTHTYANSGLYPIKVTIESKIGASATVVATATVLPHLTLTRSFTNNTLRWPAWASEFVLQTHTNLSTTNWTSVTNLPTLAGFENVLTNATAASNYFFRLKR